MPQDDIAFVERKNPRICYMNNIAHYGLRNTYAGALQLLSKFARTAKPLTYCALLFSVFHWFVC